jgi:hypothetical protein
VTCILQICNEGAVNSLAGRISIFSFSPHVVKHIECKCSHCSSYPPSKLPHTGTQQWHIHGILGVLPKEKIRVLRRARSGEQRRQEISHSLPNHCTGNMEIEKSVTSSWKHGGPSLLLELSSGHSSSKIRMTNSPNKFRYDMP